MLEGSTTAVILCGGKGERLKPYTETLPKPLVQIFGRPLLEHLLRYLSAAGLRRFILCVGYKAEVIEQFVATRPLPDAEIQCVNSGDVGMTDRILDASAFVEDRALLCYGDTLANVDLDQLEATHRGQRALATLTVHRFHSPFGIVESDSSGHVTRFVEKPVLPYWINIGFILCERAALARLHRGWDMAEFLSELARDGVLAAHRHSGRHLTVNTEKDRQEAEVQMAQFITLMDGFRV